MRKPSYMTLEGSDLELCEQFAGLCEVGGASFKHPLKL